MQLRLLALQMGAFFPFWHCLGLDCKVEGRALARHPFALHPHLSSHYLHQPLAQSQPQPGAPITPGGGSICLREGLEQPLNTVRRDANTRISHRKMQVDWRSVCCIDCLLLSKLHTDHDLSLLGEFDCITQQVDQHLPQTGDIS